SALIGLLAAGMWYRRSTHGLERRLLLDHARWLIADETVLVLQVPLETLAHAVGVLREAGEIPPVVFYLHPKRAAPAIGERKPGASLPLAQLEDHARRLAAGHRLDPRPRPNKELLDRLERARDGIHEACADLSAAGRLELSSPPVAEWILDNEYAVEANSRDVQLNLPPRYYRRLPALANPQGPGLPRIYGLAQELVSHTDLRLDREGILAFAEAYQSVHALTIGELWAYPQMLRIALIEGIQSLAAKALTELREREFAAFWASRLMTVSRRDHHQLFAIMAELTKVQPSPTPYFASQLIDHLYDEGAALGPVQAWLERVYRKPLGELNLREQNRQTRDQISVSNAFTSLRQLALLDWRHIFEELSRVEGVLRSDPAGVYPQMDFDTRDHYRRTVEGLARGSGHAESEVAQRAIDMASRLAQEP
ncbi:MAG: glycosyl transferase, partial [Anaerolineales bacterium]